MSKAAARIRAAAIEAFAERGYGGTSLRHIAASLELSPGAVYPHYKTKESLLFAISLRGHKAAFDVLRQASDSSASATDRLMDTVRAYITWQARNRDLARVVQYELRSLEPEHYEMVVSLRRDTSKLFRSIVESGYASGEFNETDIDAATLAITSLGTDVCRWFPSQSFSDPEALANRYARLAVRIVGGSPTRTHRPSPSPRLPSRDESTPI